MVTINGHNSNKSIDISVTPSLKPYDLILALDKLWWTTGLDYRMLLLTDIIRIILIMLYNKLRYRNYDDLFKPVRHGLKYVR